MVIRSYIFKFKFKFNEISSEAGQMASMLFCFTADSYGQIYDDDDDDDKAREIWCYFCKWFKHRGTAIYSCYQSLHVILICIFMCQLFVLVMYYNCLLPKCTTDPNCTLKLNSCSRNVTPATATVHRCVCSSHGSVSVFCVGFGFRFFLKSVRFSVF